MPRPGVAPPVIVVRRPGPPRLRPHGSIVREIELSEEDLEQLDDDDLWRWYQYQGQRRRNRCRTNNFATMIASTRSSTDAGTAASTNSGIINASAETSTADAGTGTAASTNSGTINASRRRIAGSETVQACCLTLDHLSQRNPPPPPPRIRCR